MEKHITTQYKIILAAAGLMAVFLTPAVNGQGYISLQIGDTGGGNTQWQLAAVSTNFIVGPYSQTGNYGEQIILPTSLFAFNYSSSFTYTFNSPIGTIEDITSGQSGSLNQINYYASLSLLAITGGVMNHSLGDQFVITNLSTSDIAIPFSVLSGDSQNSANYTPGAWHNINQVNLTLVTVPEPSILALFGFGIVGLLFSKKFYKDAGATASSSSTASSI